jgi:hypothetical protein
MTRSAGDKGKAQRSGFGLLIGVGMERGAASASHLRWVGPAGMVKLVKLDFSAQN